MNGYACFYSSKRIEVYAASSYAAQVEAAKQLKVSEKNRYKIAVVLAEAKGEPVTHSAAML